MYKLAVEVILVLTGPADIILCDSHFSWNRQKRPKSSDDNTADKNAKDLIRPWSLSDISLTILPVRGFVVCLGFMVD